jgi:DNA-directed RNA polymerase subunit omega
MARITVEDCLGKVDNRFKLIHLAAKRVRQLRKGAEPLVDSKNTDIVVSLREIAAGEVFQVEYDEELDYLAENIEDSETEELSEQAAEESPSNEETVTKEAEIEG